MSSRIYVTKHAIERIAERCPDAEINDENDSDKVLKMVEDSSVENRYLNDTRPDSYLFYTLEKYGYDQKYEFRVNTEYGLVFILAHDRNKLILVTVLPMDSYNSERYFKPVKKFKKKKKVNKFDDITSKGSDSKELKAMMEYQENIQKQK